MLENQKSCRVVGKKGVLLLFQQVQKATRTAGGIQRRRRRKDDDEGCGSGQTDRGSWEGETDAPALLVILAAAGLPV